MAIDQGTPGGSLAREYERRRQRREERVRAAHPVLGGLILSVSAPPAHERAFDRGHRGEVGVAAVLDAAASSDGMFVLHNRRMPRGRGDIDHIAITSAGVVVVDTKNVSGPVRAARGLFAAPRLIVNGRDRSSFVNGVARQTAAVRAVLADEHPDVPVRGVICLAQAGPRRGHALTLGDCAVMSPRTLARSFAPGSISCDTLMSIASLIARAFPACVPTP